MERKQLRHLRALVSLALLSLIAGALLTVLEGLLGSAYGITLALAAALITFYCYRRADKSATASQQYYLWRYLPLVLFVIVPLIVYIFIRVDRGWSLETLVLGARLLATFLVPLACLLYVERGLKRAQY